MAKEILLADSGSTKCAWIKITGDRQEGPFVTNGINPFFRDSASIENELVSGLMPNTGNTIHEIFFYGSGITSEISAGVILPVLNKLYPKATIELHSDVLAAARSLFGSRRGIACILGTGSNACLYDGSTVIGGISPLGFILGDEGSGAVMGRRLLGDFFKEVMPLPLREKFAATYSLTRETALHRVYKSERPNHFLATFVPFLSAEIADPYCREFVKQGFMDFFDRNVVKIPEHTTCQIGFVGSVAYYFQEILLEVCEDFGMECAAIVQSPMEGLIKYHLEKP